MSLAIKIGLIGSLALCQPATLQIFARGIYFDRWVLCLTCFLRAAGILDQGSGVLIVYDGSETDKTYTHALETITHMGKVVDALFKKAQKLS